MNPDTDEAPEHERTHNRERQVAKETAERLEREVQQNAQRIEKKVEEEAARVQKGVETALKAVSDTATVHAQAHTKEHVAHENIHKVEKAQVDKAERAQEARDQVARESLEEYKKTNNEWGKTFRQLTTNYPQRLEMDAKFGALEKDINSNTEAVRDLRELVVTQFAGQSGKTEGLTSTAKLVVGAAALLASVITVVSVILAFNN